jgi:hypothetical protein
MTLSDERVLTGDYVTLAREAKALASRCQNLFGAESRCAVHAQELVSSCEKLARITNPDRTPATLPADTNMKRVL